MLRSDVMHWIWWPWVKAPIFRRAKLTCAAAISAAAPSAAYWAYQGWNRTHLDSASHLTTDAPQLWMLTTLRARVAVSARLSY